MSSKNLKEIADKARKNDFISISELMTGIENRVFSRKEVSQLIFKESHKSLKIGITGPPGAGKSSLMNKLIPQIRKENLSVGVIAIDPSSPITGGSFLGDRVRINNDVNDDNVDFGILICGSANGVAMTANKYQKVRAGVCWTSEITELTRQHNNANVRCIPARFTSIPQAIKMVDVFLNTEFEGGRHKRRVDKIAISC